MWGKLPKVYEKTHVHTFTTWASYCLPMWSLTHLVTRTKSSLDNPEITTPIKGLGTSSYAVDTLRDKNIW